jgi:hypothetical protein
LPLDPLGGGLPLFTSYQEEVFSETRRPAYGVLGSARALSGEV